ncbi:MAG: ABC transporter substrate-binding protein, partial [Anaerolineales bacterium]
MKRRFHAQSLALAVLASLLLAACGGATPTAAPVATQPAATQAPQATQPPPTTAPTVAAKGGSVIWGTESEPDTMDHQCTFSSIADVQHRTIFDSLVFWGPDKEFYPYLAESWEINDDFTSYTFHLRDDVTFHDGTPFNAEAVKFNFDRLTTAECAAG